MKDRIIITLPDGYNGDTREFYLPPVKVFSNGSMKLECVDTSYLFKYVDSDYIKKHIK